MMPTMSTATVPTAIVTNATVPPTTVPTHDASAAFEEMATATLNSYLTADEGVHAWLMPGSLFLLPGEDAAPRTCKYNEVRELVEKAVGDCSWKIQRDRIECLEQLHYTISWKSLSDTDKEMLRKIERAILYGDMFGFQDYIRRLPDSDRERLLNEANVDFKSLGYEIFHVRARSLANGGNVGDHDFVIVIRRKSTIVEIHVDARVPSTVVVSINAPWLPLTAVSDIYGDGLPPIGSPNYQTHEAQAKKGFESMAIEAALAWGSRPKKTIEANWQ